MPFIAVFLRYLAALNVAYGRKYGDTLAKVRAEPADIVAFVGALLRKVTFYDASASSHSLPSLQV